MQAKQLTQESIIARLDELPTLPTIVYELSRVINNPMSSTSHVEEIMSNDQSLTAKVLRLVNSAYYAIPGGVTTLSRAIGYIGFDTINQLVLSSSILSALKTTGPQRFDLNEFWKHAIGVGIAGETIAKYLRHPTPTDLFTCGLVHDMGKVALYTLEPDSMISLLQYCEANQVSYQEAETALEIPTHAQIGYWLAKKWKLPPVISGTIRFHHTKDPNIRPGITAELNRDVDVVLLANLMIHALKFGHSGHSKILHAPKEVLARLTLRPDDDFKPLVNEIKINLDKAADFLRVLQAGSL